jgi:hypothetical protein
LSFHFHNAIHGFAPEERIAMAGVINIFRETDLGPVKRAEIRTFTRETLISNLRNGRDAGPEEDRQALDNFLQILEDATDRVRRKTGTAEHKKQTVAISQEYLGTIFSELSDSDLNNLFERLRHHGLMSRFKALCKDQFSPFSDALQKQFSEVKKRHHYKQKPNGMPSRPSTKALKIRQPEGLAVYGVRVVDLDKNPVEDDKVYEPTGQTGQASSGHNIDAPHPRKNRTGWILRALIASGIDADNITVFQKKDVKDDRRNAAHHPYRLIEVNTGNIHCQIAVTDSIGHVTYVIKQPKPHSGHPSIRISELCCNDTVWRAPFVTKESGQKEIVRLVHTPIADLEPQINSIRSWAPLKGALIASFVAHVMAEGTPPSAHGTIAVTHGPLAGATTWRRAYYALYDERINGLAGIRSFQDLQQYTEVQTLFAAAATAGSNGNGTHNAPQTRNHRAPADPAEQAIG